MVAKLETRNPELETPNRIYKVSEKRDALIQKVERGDRVKQIRDALDMTGDEFAVEIATRLKAYGVTRRYNKSKVSLMESGTRKLTVEEVVILAELGGKERGAAWLVFGDVAKTIAVTRVRRGDGR